MPLTDADLWRLVEATGSRPDLLVEWLGPEQIDMVGEPESFVRLSVGRRLMVLRHGANGCQFLHEERCRVYANRPTSCAAFPFHVASDQLSFEMIPGAPCEPVAPPPLPELARTSSRLAGELESYAAKVAIWNRRQQVRLRLHRRPESQERFFDFLRKQG